MKFFKSKPVIHHFKLHFPIQSSNVQSCVNKIQQLTTQNTEAIFLSLNGICSSLQAAQTLHNSFKITNERYQIPVYTFLQQNTTSLTYLASTCGNISANPYCVIGDIGTTQISYTNIQKLMQFLNIKLDLVSCHQNKMPWNPFFKADQSEQQISQKWLNVVQQTMIKTVSERRRIPIETLKTLKNKVLTPKQALANKLIDHIQTAQEFKDTHYPQVKVQQHVFTGKSATPAMTGDEIKVMMKIEEVLSMPKVAMFSLQDPLNECIRDFTQILKIRMENQQKLEELDSLLGEVFKKIEVNLQKDGNCFLL